MKKSKWIILIGLILSVAVCLSAMAQTTGIAVDGKTYTFAGSRGTYEADGKTFIIGADTVTIREPGKEDRLLALSHTSENENSIIRDTAVFVQSAAETDDSAATYEEITIVEDSQSAAYMEKESENTGNSVARAAINEYSRSAYILEDAAVDPSRFDEYAKFGLSFDAENNALYYQGKRVRIFEDVYSLDDQSCVSLEHVDDRGVIDVQAKRDMMKKSYYADGSDDLTATLAGLKVLSETEFAARRLSDWTQTEVESAATEAEMTIAEKEAFYAPYAAFGLRYDVRSDALIYRGLRVRKFMDIRQSNGEALEGGRFHGVMIQTAFDAGEVDIETIRDYSKTDANGDGTLIGLSSEKAR